ncbi:MAG TPA: MMPL family transporter [Clostridiaceae bacterium]|nr:MMPL family transporter [Clostridiaceae bacterium]
MQKIINWIIKHHKAVLVVFILLTVISGILMLQVKVNYNLQEYLPEDVPSTKALNELENSYEYSIPNARAVFKVESLQEALVIKEKLKASEGITQVLWLDDSVDLMIPLELQDQDLVEAFYTGEKALFQLTAETDNAVEVLEGIYQIDPEVAVTGQLTDLANAQNAVQSEMLKIVTVMTPLVIIILIIGTHSWIEPFIFLLTIGVGIVLNMGTNIFFGEVSFITQAVAAVLQLAVSMDYAIFLLNRFNDNRKMGYEPEVALAMAMRKALTAIASSAMTTVFGFLALIFMRFRIGTDLGIVMAKGIVLSFFSVMVFMPTVLLALYKLIDKTTHRPLLPDFNFLGKFVNKIKMPLLILALIVAIPGFMGSRANHFIYGMGGLPKGSKLETDKKAIEEEFGIQQQMALMVPKGNIQKELMLQSELENTENVLSVISYVSKVDKAIPVEVIDDPALDMLVSDNYTQFIITGEVASEGEDSFELVERVRQIGKEAYGDQCYLVGENVVMLDMKNTIEADDIVVNGLAILAIALVIMAAFRSLSVPVILVLTIEIAIWINLSIPYFVGTSLSYIGYLIISTVQLGATVDYAILYTEHYLDNRVKLHKSNALIQSIRESVPSLLPPALILTLAGFALYYTSTLTIVQELGLVLGRGAILSLFMVIFVLPGFLFLFDKIIEKTSYKRTFLRKDQSEINENINDHELNTEQDLEEIL